MERAAAKFEAALIRQANAANRLAPEFKIADAAALGLGDSTISLIQKLASSGAAFVAVGTQGGNAFKSVVASADAASTQTQERTSLIVNRIREAKKQADELRASAQTQNAAGTLSDDGLKLKLASINTVYAKTIEQVKVLAEQEIAARNLAAVESTSAAARATAAQKIVDAQNGLTASYRTQLVALRELRDAGALTPAQFKQAGADLVGKNPAVAQRAQEAAAAKAAADSIADSAVRATAAQRASNDAFIASVNSRANAIGKTAGQLLSEQAALKGVTSQTAAAIAKISDFEAKTGQLGKGVFATRNQLLTLQYTISDVIASAGSGISPLTILLQQGPQLAQLEGGISGVFKTALSLITPFRIAMLGAGAAVGVLGFAFLEGQKQSKAFADNLVLTGNFAGITEGRFNAMAKGISASGQISISAAREFTQALVGTGEIGPKNLDKAAEAAARYGAATGKSAKDVAAEFASLNNDVTAGATKLNQSLNFLTAAQLQQIRTLQEQGNSADALGIVYEALNSRLAKLEPNLGTLDRILRGVSTTWKGFWDAAYDIGRAETIEEKIGKVEKRIAQFKEQGLSAAKPGEGYTPSGGSPRITQQQADADQVLRNGLLRQKGAQDSAAIAGADQLALEKKAAVAGDYYRAAEKGTKSLAGLTRELATEEKNYQILLAASQVAKARGEKSVDLPSPALRAAEQKRIRDSYTDKGGASDADAQRKAQLDQDLKFLKDNQAQEAAARQFHQQFLQGVYAAGDLSLTDYYAARRKATADGVQGELNELIDAQARLEVELGRGGFKNQAEKTGVQTKLDEARAASAALTLKAQRDATTATQDEAAAIKVLSDRVADYRANLLQLAGDDAGAARLRTAQAIAAAQLLAKQSTGSGSAINEQKVRLQEELATAANAYAEAQKKVGIFTGIATSAEELFLRTALRTGPSLAETESGVSALRARSLTLLREQLELLKATAGTDLSKLAQVAALAAQIEIAADRSDAALNRLRDSVKSVSDSIADDIGNAINDFKGVGPLLDSITKDVQRSVTKLFVTDPLKVVVQAQLKGLTEGDGALAKLLRETLGVKVAIPEKIAALETAVALNALTTAASGAAAALSGGGIASSITTGDFARFDRLPEGSTDPAPFNTFLATLTKNGTAAADNFGSAAAKLILSTDKTSAAFGGLPGLLGQFGTSMIQVLQSLAAGSGGSGGGIGGFIASLFGGGGGASGPTSGDFARLDRLPGLAVGTNYVPYDGFKASLHKGEAVVPAKYNPAAGGGFGGGSQGSRPVTLNVINNGSPVQAKSTQRETSEGTVIELVLDAVAADMAGGGKVHDATQRRFGLNPGGTTPRY